MSKTSLSFFVPGQPIAQPRHRIARGGGQYIQPRKDGSPHRVHAWKELIALTAKQKEWELVEYPNAIEIALRFYFTKPKSKSRLKYPTVKPDRDNLEKAVTDAMEGIIYENDSQIVDGITSKRYVSLGAYSKPGVYIYIKRL